MTLLTRVAKLRTAAVVVDDVAKIKSRTGAFRTLAERVERPAKILPGLITGLDELAMIDVFLGPDTLKGATEILAGLRALASALPGMSVDAPLDVSKLQVMAVENFTRELRVFVSADWINYRDQKLPPVNEELVEALAAGGVDVEDVRNELIGAQVVLTRLKVRDIPGSGDVAKFESAVEVLRVCGETISTLVDSDLAEGILKSQSDKGIPLDWFTPDRISAFAKLGILNRFRVTLR